MRDRIANAPGPGGDGHLSTMTPARQSPHARLPKARRRHADCRYREFTVGWANRHLANLERWLDGREFIATEAFTVADILMAHALDEIKDKSLIEPYARVASYREKCFARPAWKRAIESYCARVEAS